MMWQCGSRVLTICTWIHYGSFSSTTKINFFKNQVSVSNKDIQGRELRIWVFSEKDRHDANKLGRDLRALAVLLHLITSMHVKGESCWRAIQTLTKEPILDFIWSHWRALVWRTK